MQVGIIRIGEHRKLVEPDAAMPVPNGARKCCRDAWRAATVIHNDKVVAQPVHLHEGQCICGGIGHEGAYSDGARTNPDAKPFVGLTLPREVSK